jgi:hypothetical protein
MWIFLAILGCRAESPEALLNFILDNYNYHSYSQIYKRFDTPTKRKISQADFDKLMTALYEQSGAIEDAHWLSDDIRQLGVALTIFERKLDTA